MEFDQQNSKGMLNACFQCEKIGNQNVLHVKMTYYSPQNTT